MQHLPWITAKINKRCSFALDVERWVPRDLSGTMYKPTRQVDVMKWNPAAALTSIMTCRSAISWTPALHRMITVPVASKPLRPALPAIWIYSPKNMVHGMSTGLKMLVFPQLQFILKDYKALVMAAEMESIKPGSRFRKPVPSCFLMLSNTTVLAGMFTPIAKVSVANSTWERKGRCRQLVELFLFANEGECSK